MDLRRAITCLKSGIPALRVAGVALRVSLRVRSVEMNSLLLRIDRCCWRAQVD
jgi:hypothetical protein